MLKIGKLYIVVALNNLVMSCHCNPCNVELTNFQHLGLGQMQMVFSPKHCAVCFTRINIKKELVCLNCFGAAYCSAEHQASDNHQKVCSDFQKALDMDLFMLNVNIDSPDIPLIKPDQAINLKLDMYDMRSFIANYVKPGLKLEEETLISFYYSNVLTFTYIINRIPRFTLGKRLVIHIVGALTVDEGRVIRCWENLLHFFPGLHHVLIVHIGPGIAGSPNRLRLCLVCNRANKFIDCFFFNQFYHEYCNNPCFMRPDVIIAFNTGLYDECESDDWWDWDSTLPFFFQYDKVPLISTDWTKSAAEGDLEKLLRKNVIGDKKVSIVVNCEKNPFNNLRLWKSEDNYEDTDNPFLIKNSYVFALIVEGDQ